MVTLEEGQLCRQPWQTTVPVNCAGNCGAHQREAILELTSKSMALTEVCRACAPLEAQSASSQEKVYLEDKLLARVTGSTKLLDHSLVSDVSEPVMEDVSVLFLAPLSPLSASPLSPLSASSPRRGALLLTWDSLP